MPYVSAEVRWFLAARYATEVTAFDSWFKAGRLPPGGGKKPREDVYALDLSTEELGVKTREGKSGLEVKTLVDAHLLSLAFGTRAATAQLWSKVTSHILTLPADVRARRTVRKRRWLRTFATATSGATEVKLGVGLFGEEPLQGSPPTWGCNVEWTLVEVPGWDGQWWTFGLEAFAFEPAAPVCPLLEQGLRRTLPALIASLGQPPQLGEVWREQSYPAWLRSG